MREVRKIHPILLFFQRILLFDILLELLFQRVFVISVEITIKRRTGTTTHMQQKTQPAAARSKMLREREGGGWSEW